MKITFYGVRGSIPVANKQMMKYGGNTSCVYVQLSDGGHIIFDAGTGIRRLGKELASSNEPIHLLLSHNHWDHVMGYPFFQPIYQKDREIHIYSSQPNSHGQLCTLLDQMDGAHFPITAEQLPSKSRCVLSDIDDELRDSGFTIQRRLLNHPGGGNAYKIIDDGATCAYITDNELDISAKRSANYDQWVEFCSGVDVLIHDAQYRDDEFPSKKGWGHSGISTVRQLALDAEVRELFLFHHDPDRTDAEMDQLFQQTRTFFLEKNQEIQGVCAVEGMSVQVDKDNITFITN